MTQNERILRHLQDGGTLTQAEAFLEYGVGRLSSRICDLRRATLSRANLSPRKTDMASLVHLFGIRWMKPRGLDYVRSER